MKQLRMVQLLDALKPPQVMLERAESVICRMLAVVTEFHAIAADWLAPCCSVLMHPS